MQKGGVGLSPGFGGASPGGLGGSTMNKGMTGIPGGGAFSMKGAAGSSASKSFGIGGQKATFGGVKKGWQ